MLMDFKYIDTHGHLNDKAFDGDREDIIKELNELKIATTVVGTDLDMSQKAIALANREEGRFAIVGQHPHDNHVEEFDYNQYLEWSKLDSVVGIGECGLDYFWTPKEEGVINESKEKERQRGLFLKQIEIARIVDKPLVIHGRPSKGTMDAYHDILNIIKSESSKSGNDIKGVAHFFAGDMEIAKEFLDLGFSCSFTGVLTFVQSYDDIVRYIPEDKIMAETDAPYVAPVPYRGKRNEMKYVIEVYKAISRIRNVGEEEMRIQLNQNAHNFFSI